MNENKIIKMYEPLIYKISKRFYNVDSEDLYQAGCIGLIKAYRKFDTSKNTNFINFAYMHIFGEMYDLANASRDIKLNKAYLKLAKDIEIAKKMLYEKLLRIPTSEELSLFLEIDEFLLSEVEVLTSKMISIDTPIDNNDKSLTIKDCLGRSDDIDNKILIEESMQNLSDNEQAVIKNRYYNDMTQEEVAKKLGLSQVKVSRLEKKGKEKIKQYINA